MEHFKDPGYLVPLTEACEALLMLGYPNKVRILNLLVTIPGGQLSITETAQIMNLGYKIVAENMKSLLDKNFLKVRTEDREKIYCLNTGSAACMATLPTVFWLSKNSAECIADLQSAEDLINSGVLDCIR